MADAGGTPAVEPAAFAELEASIGDDQEFLRELVDTYLEDAPQQVEGMRHGLQGGDRELLHRSAHTLKSNSASLGATTLSAMCRELEALTGPRRDNVDASADLGERVAAIAEELERVGVELNALVPVDAS